MTIAEGFKLFGEALGCEFTDEQSIAEVLSAISKKFGGASAQTIADAAAELAKVSDQIGGGGIDLFGYDIQQIDYDDGDGTLDGEYDADAATVAYVEIPDSKTFVSCMAKFANNSTGIWCAYLYDENKAYMFDATDSGGFLSWSDYLTRKEIPEGAKYIRFVIKNSSKTAFPLEDLSSAKAVFE